MITIDNNDTICAISTPAGVGGIAVARVSGPLAITITDRIWKGKPLTEAASHTAHLGSVTDPDNGETIDQGVATVFRAPGTFTGEDVVELSVHGSKFIQRELIALLLRQGCRLAEPGEFTRRAYTSGRMDLTEAEAVADLIAASSRAAHRIALSQMKGNFTRRLETLREQLLELASLLELELDFSEEDVEFASRTRLKELAIAVSDEICRLERSFATGQAIKEGIPVAIVGETNVGKSSLLNILVGDDRAIVSDVHGTTRDLIEDTAEIGDLLFRFIDTAGLRETADTVEAMGIERSHAAAGRARVVMLVSDAARPLQTALIDETLASMRDDASLILVINKTDLINHDTLSQTIADATQRCPTAKEIIAISARNGDGIDTLKAAIQNAAGADRIGDDQLLVTNARHSQALARAARSIARVIDGLDTSLPGDLIAQDLRETLHHLADITPAITTPDLLASIFSRFCVGK